MITRIELAAQLYLNLSIDSTHFAQRNLKLSLRKKKANPVHRYATTTPRHPNSEPRPKRNESQPENTKSPSAHMHMEKIPLPNLRNIVHNVLIVQ
jgi:hypothetical protein